MRPSLLALLLVACGPPSSMIAWRDAHDAAHGYDVRAFADGSTLAIELVQPGLMGLVLYPPSREGDSVVLTPGLVSSGASGERTWCFDVSALDLASDWADRVRWREPGGHTVAIDVVRGPEAAAAIAGCLPAAP